MHYLDIKTVDDLDKLAEKINLNSGLQVALHTAFLAGREAAYAELRVEMEAIKKILVNRENQPKRPLPY